MDKINFENLPSTNTPMNADNLNKMQDNIENAINDKFVYSTEEKIIGIWIDGKSLYRKVVDLGAMPNADQKSVAHNISNLGDVIYIGGYYTNGSNRFMLPSVRAIPEYIDQYQAGIWTNDTSIVVEIMADRSEYNGFAIIEYTKTTD